MNLEHNHTRVVRIEEEPVYEIYTNIIQCDDNSHKARRGVLQSLYHPTSRNQHHHNKTTCTNIHEARLIENDDEDDANDEDGFHRNRCTSEFSRLYRNALLHPPRQWSLSHSSSSSLLNFQAATTSGITTTDTHLSTSRKRRITSSEKKEKKIAAEINVPPWLKFNSQGKKNAAKRSTTKIQMMNRKNNLKEYEMQRRKLDIQTRFMLRSDISTEQEELFLRYL